MEKVSGDGALSGLAGAGFSCIEFYRNDAFAEMRLLVSCGEAQYEAISAAAAAHSSVYYGN